MTQNFQSPAAKAKEVLQRYNITAAPVDVEEICRQEKIAVLHIDMGFIEKKAKKEISGAIQKHPERGCTILVNEADIKPRARFTIAHELGHYYLHMNDSDDKIITSFRMDRSPIEAQANKFAAELLMPEDLVREAHSSMVIPICDSLAGFFCVSKQAMRLRLDNLGLVYV